MPSSNTPVTGTVQTPASAKAMKLYEQFHGTMLERARQNGLSDEDKTQITADQIARIFAGDSTEAIWQADMGGTVQARDAHNMKVRILDFRPVVSTKEFANSHGWYGTMNAVCLGGPMHILRACGLKVGDDFVLQTGADLFLAKVAAFESRDDLPLDGTVQATETASGNHVIKFWPASEQIITVQEKSE
jgi:hypothetical protein